MKELLEKFFWVFSDWISLLKEDKSDEAIKKFETIKFDYKKIREHSLKFSKERFEKEIEESVNEKYEIFKKERL